MVPHVCQLNRSAVGMMEVTFGTTFNLSASWSLQTTSELLCSGTRPDVGFQRLISPCKNSRWLRFSNFNDKDASEKVQLAVAPPSICRFPSRSEQGKQPEPEPPGPSRAAVVRSVILMSAGASGASSPPTDVSPEMVLRLLLI